MANYITLHVWNEKFDTKKNLVSKKDMERFGFFTKKDIESFFKILKKQSKIEVSKDFICFDASIFKYLEVDMDLRKYFKINYNNKLYEVNEKSLEKALTCTTELFFNLYMKNIGLKL